MYYSEEIKTRSGIEIQRLIIRFYNIIIIIIVVVIVIIIVIFIIIVIIIVIVIIIIIVIVVVIVIIISSLSLSLSLSLSFSSALKPSMIFSTIEALVSGHPGNEKNCPLLELKILKLTQ